MSFNPDRINDQCKLASQAWPSLANQSALSRRQALEAMATSLWDRRSEVLSANQRDVKAGQDKGLSVALIDRLSLDDARISGIVASIRQIASLRDPLGEVMSGWVCENGLKINKVRVPLGVIAIIYEARPNVTADAIALCVKTGNAVVLRGSASAYQSNFAITTILKSAMQATGLPQDSVQLLEDTTHEGVWHLVSLRQYINIAIPRGGASLIQNVITHAKVPTIETGVGNCHIFVDDSANLDQALAIIRNAKAQRPSVCNACETVLVHQAIAKVFLPKLAQAMAEEKVEIRGCDQTCAIIQATPATETDWENEFLDLILAVKVVADTTAAIAHIRQYGTQHSESILSNSRANISDFTTQIDAAAVLVNASTRFVDGGEFGFGAELGISTQKLHARGPMGLPELTTYKYIVEGDGHIRA